VERSKNEWNGNCAAGTVGIVGVETLTTRSAEAAIARSAELLRSAMHNEGKRGHRAGLFFCTRWLG
jgi:hypothetical protein